MSDHVLFTHGDGMLGGFGRFGGASRDHMVARSLLRKHVKLFCHSCCQSPTADLPPSKHGTIGRSTLLVGARCQRTWPARFAIAKFHTVTALGSPGRPIQHRKGIPAVAGTPKAVRLPQDRSGRWLGVPLDERGENFRRGGVIVRDSDSKSNLHSKFRVAAEDVLRGRW